MNYSRITDRLYIGTTPKTEDYALLRELEVRLVINMRIGLPPRRDLHYSPMKSIWLPAIDSPIFPIPMRFLKTGVKEARQVMESGGSVYTHCSKGRHRGPAMGACILIAQGMTPEEAMRLIKARRPASDLQAWYIRRRIMKFAREWDKSEKENASLDND
ncbi:MAG: dual specificity protein phosphatase [Anaerolineales bacterium]